MAIEIKLPELGDGIDSGDVLSVLVQEGDQVDVDQGLVELETDKATVEVPSTHAGKVVRIHVSAGDTLPVGGTIVTLESIAAASPPPAEPAPEPEPEPQPSAVETLAASEPTPSSPSKPNAATPPPPNPAAPPKKAKAAPAAKAGGVVAAGPAVRRFAREVGVDLTQVTGTGEGGRITRDDVLAAVRQASSGAAATADEESDGFGPVRRERMTRMRKAIASQMHLSWSTVPRVTNFDDADVTDLEAFRQASKADYAEKGIKLTSMPFLIKAVAMALKEHPLVNASLDMENEQVVYKEYVNIGVAVDSERGLVVPSLRGADDLAIPEIARDFMDLINKVRNNDYTIDDLRGSTFTISNLGAIGGTYSTPIVNVPEVAILLVGRSRKMPIVKDDEVVTRLMMPMSLSYDHRLVDGATAARFLNEVIGFLEAPGRLLLAP